MIHTKQLVSFAVASLLSVVLSSCGQSEAVGILRPVADPPANPPTVAGKAKVSIDNFSFTPQILHVSAGTTVTWTNHDDVPHTVKSTEKKFLSGTLDTDDAYSFTFTKPGTYPYFCTVHSHMTGTVEVK